MLGIGCAAGVFRAEAPPAHLCVAGVELAARDWAQLCSGQHTGPPPPPPTWPAPAWRLDLQPPPPVRAQLKPPMQPKLKPQAAQGLATQQQPKPRQGRSTRADALKPGARAAGRPKQGSSSGATAQCAGDEQSVEAVLLSDLESLLLSGAGSGTGLDDTPPPTPTVAPQPKQPTPTVNEKISGSAQTGTKPLSGKAKTEGQGKPRADMTPSVEGRAVGQKAWLQGWD